MKRLLLAVPVLASLALPISANAHEHQIYKIGNSYYQFTVGSLNEPIAVDDKTGVELAIAKCKDAMCSATMSADGDMDGVSGTPVTGLDQTLKVELIAGGQKKTLDLKPLYGVPGTYTAAFYPTVATTLTYRFVGLINETPVDLSFNCLPVGSVKAVDDMSEIKVSDGVTRTHKGGSFGCPADKASLGFPEKSVSLVALQEESAKGGSMGRTGTMTAVAALVVSAYAVLRRRS